MTITIADPDEPYLLTPGPLTTSHSVKQAMLRDWGSWDGDFRAMTTEVRQRLLSIAHPGDPDLDCIPVQGSGTFAVEAMLGSFLPRGSKTLVLMNGAYGQRVAETLDYLGRAYTTIDKGDYLPPRGAEVLDVLKADPDLSHVVLVHCETSSGILNPVEEIAKVVTSSDRTLLLDSMSAFGGVPLDVSTVPYTAMVSSANKCIEGVPGFGFVLARKDAFESAKGNAHSLSLDLHAQWAHMKKTGQWRFTPPTHVLAAFLQALREHETEGGVAKRHARYARNRDVLVDGMRGLGFETLLADHWLSPIIVTFFCPSDPDFTFEKFYDGLKRRGFIIYPGKLTVVDSFRIGCIGRIDETVMHRVVDAVQDTLTEMGVTSAAPPVHAMAERERLLP
jgi:2-aminoethylphosphonate-pyruvate transaminase